MSLTFIPERRVLLATSSDYFSSATNDVRIRLFSKNEKVNITAEDVIEFDTSNEHTSPELDISKNVSIRIDGFGYCHDGHAVVIIMRSDEGEFLFRCCVVRTEFFEGFIPFLQEIIRSQKE